MRSHRSKLILFSLFLMLGIYLLLPAFQVLAQDSRAAQPDRTADLSSPAQVDSHLAGMSDGQIRQAYAQKLKQDAQKQSAATQASQKGRPVNKVIDSFYGAARAAGAVLKRVGSIFSAEDRSAVQWGDVAMKLSAGKGAPYLFGTLAGLAVIVALGWFLRWLFLRTTSDIRKNLINAVRLGKLQFFGRLLSRILLDALGAGVYVLTTFILFVMTFQEGKPSYDIVSVYLIVSYYIIAFLFGARVIFSPQAASLRLFPMDDRDASFMYNWVVRIVLLVGIITGASMILQNYSVNRQLYLMTYSSAGAVVILAMVVMIWQSRKRVTQAILAEDADQGPRAGSLRAAFARNWHCFAMLLVLVAGGIWVAKALNEENVTVVSLIISIFLIPIVIGVDQWVQRLLKIASGESRETIDLSGDAPPVTEEQPEPAGKMDIANWVPLIRRFFRIFLVVFLFFGSFRLWGIDIEVGRMFTRSALSILLILLLSFITWQLIKARIDQKIKEEMPDDDGEAEEGGAGGSRMGTLLVLLRKFVFVVLFVMVALIILASMGVNIGPLIAGAGVFGLAIGFGAQTLVKDIIAGVFFLIDDAFRVGDFIECSGTKGSVEHISLRSLRLRNARGPVHTIPFGSMGTVTNMSRDYIITKLDFRVRYDTNVDKVRKIIKQINKEIAKDPEMGPNLLDKIKSQGVKELDDSAMVMRLKFKTIPGEQFVIRREVFRMIQESFAESGIEFAHRNVTVYMPPDEKAGDHDKKAAAAGAAAAAAVAQAEAEQQKPK
ncbi:MAG: mechanosensitive ion channel family protein [bacterium]|nr:mechanosensitive ion channel family protein [bacterium]